jgi:UDP-N-acetylglucosamine:LPS N-acetylglucosamine transferase
MVLITMGGIPQPYDFLEHLSHSDNIRVVVPGGSDTLSNNGHLITLPHHSSFFHPDLIHAADAVIGKVGYSTVAEVYHGGVPFGFIKRPDFRESDILSAYIEEHMSGLGIDEASFRTGKWMSSVPRLLEMPRIGRNGPNGATQVAKFICSLIGSDMGSFC